MLISNSDLPTVAKEGDLAISKHGNVPFHLLNIGFRPFQLAQVAFGVGQIVDALLTGQNPIMSAHPMIPQAWEGVAIIDRAHAMRCHAPMQETR
jgi:hypothetical protein